MSGDTDRNDDQDLSDDFILEDAPSADPEPAPAMPPVPPTGTPPANIPRGDLSRLFDDDLGAATDAATTAGAPPAAGEDDMLFVDHTAKVQPTVEFEGRRQFAEASGMQWKGNRMTPEEIGIPIEGGPETDAAAAEASFTSQLDALLEEDEFAVDSEQELQLVDSDADLDAVGVPAAGDTFILDEGNGQWRDAGAEVDGEAAAGTAETAGESGESAEFAPEPAEFTALPAAAAAEEEFTGEIDEVSVAQVEPFEAGMDAAEPEATEAAAESLGETDDAWEPLPNAAEQFEAEVAGPVTSEGEVDEAAEVAAVGPALVGAGVAAGEGLDPAIYVDDQAMRVVGGQVAHRRPWLRAFTSLAAAVLVLGAGAAVVLRPEWFGLRFQPDLVERVNIARPDVDVRVAQPVMPRAAVNPETISSGANDPNASSQPQDPKPIDPSDPGVRPADPLPTDPPVNTGSEQPGDPAPTPPDSGQVPVTVDSPAHPAPGETTVPQPDVPDPGVATLPPVGTGQTPTVPIGTGETSPPPDGPATAPPADPAVSPVGKQDEPAPSGDTTLPPNVAVTTPVTGAESIPAPAPAPLLPAGPDLLIGEPVAVEGPAAHAPPGVVPGGKAFAQLHNGNFFVGAIKAVGKDAITMRLDGGEVTLAMADVSRVAPLDSSEFQALQESTSGFLRLSNRNRLVGTILKDMADDHYVLQMKSNRLMVPKDQIESIQGGASGGVTVGGTKDDEAWLRELAARMLQESAGTPRKPD